MEEIFAALECASFPDDFLEDRAQGSWMSEKHYEQVVSAGTNIVIYILRGKSPAARTRLAELQGSAIAAILAVTEGELLYGLAKSGGGEAPRRSLKWFLARTEVLAWGRDEAAAYGLLRAKQEQLGNR